MSETSKPHKPGYIDNGWPEGSNDDHAVTELVAPVVGALSPFGDVEFPQAHVPYIHPSTSINR